MFYLLPFLMAVVPSIIILLISWWFGKRDYPLFVRMLPTILLSMSAVIIFYISIVYIRGFEGAFYGMISFFLVILAIISFFIGKRVNAK